MFQAIRINNLRAANLLRITSSSPTSHIDSASLFPRTAVRFAQAAARDSTEPSSSSSDSNMEQTQPKKTDPIQKGDLMSHSFGDGYATRSDEEGFGGIYGGNTSEEEINPAKISRDDPLGHYDKTQGSEVKEKEAARHQTKVDPKG